MPTQTFTPGVYTLFNGQFGTVLELDSADRSSVRAGAFRGRPDQQWEFIPIADGFAIRCSESLGGQHDGLPAYLGFYGSLRSGERLLACPCPMIWHVVQQEGLIRLTFSTKYSMDLDVHGKQRVQLFSTKREEKCQLWYPSRCDVQSLMGLDLDGRGGPVHNGGGAALGGGQVDMGRGAAPGPGPQLLENVKSGTVLDLWSGDRRSLLHSPRATRHKERNQVWTFIPSGDGYAIQSGWATAAGEPLYITVEGPAVAGAAVVATPYPVSWDVRRCATDGTGATYRVYWPGTSLVMAFTILASGTQARLARFCNLEQEVWRAIQV